MQFMRRRPQPSDWSLLSYLHSDLGISSLGGEADFAYASATNSVVPHDRHEAGGRYLARNWRACAPTGSKPLSLAFTRLICPIGVLNRPWFVIIGVLNRPD